MSTCRRSAAPPGWRTPSAPSCHHPAGAPTPAPRRREPAGNLRRGAANTGPAPLIRGLIGGVGGLVSQLRYAYAADAAALHLLGRQPVVVEHRRLALGRHVSEQVEEEA